MFVENFLERAHPLWDNSPCNEIGLGLRRYRPGDILRHAHKLGERIRLFLPKLLDDFLNCRLRLGLVGEDMFFTPHPATRKRLRQVKHKLATYCSQVTMSYDQLVGCQRRHSSGKNREDFRSDFFWLY